jgi:hypothetical protein
MNKFLFLVIMTTTVFATIFSTINANAQQVPPLEKPNTTETTAEEASDPISTSSLGKITIQISQTEQIVIDLPMKTDNKYKVVPIK